MLNNCKYPRHQSHRSTVIRVNICITNDQQDVKLMALPRNTCCSTVLLFCPAPKHV
ncbi:MAG: hypothetical protein M5U34_40925 [Chloroflexi bacterium]|nr:hypothetical protein [Chloroflexota bacterium]